MRVEFLLLGDQRDIAEDAVAPLLVQRGQDAVVVGLRVAEPLACQHLLNTRGTAIRSALALRPPARPPAAPTRERPGALQEWDFPVRTFLPSASLVPSFSGILLPPPLRALSPSNPCFPF